MRINMRKQRTQIVATMGAPCPGKGAILVMAKRRLGAVRLNFSWSNPAERLCEIALIREIAHELHQHIPIIADLPGPRVQEEHSHTYRHNAPHALTEKDKELIRFCAHGGIDYIALSFVSGTHEIEEARKILKEEGGDQRIIAKIERKIAVEHLDAIIKAADAVMVARGDLGNEVLLEQIPFTQEAIIRKAKAAGKPVIVATQMMLSMVNSPTPTRAEVTDVANAVLQGADAVMLSEETAIGKYPLETITMMEKIIVEAEKHMKGKAKLNLL